jgi:L-aspartate oxidase
MSATYLPRALLTETPGWTVSADVIVVGSGIAGLTTALEARKAGRVLLVTKTRLAESSTAWAQGGIAAALHPEDSPDQHLHDTLVAGVGLCDEAAVRILVTEGPSRVRELAQLGTEFERTADGSLALTREGGHRRDRVAHAGGDATGKEISRALIAALQAVRDDPDIEVIEHALVTDVLTDARQRACGVMLHVIGEGSNAGVGAALARSVVLATGGLGQVYASTTNPRVSTGDGVAVALRAGAEIADLEFVQFHPTVLWLGRSAEGQQPLISEAVRGEGALLRDIEGRRFMPELHELAELAPRDVVAKGVLTAMEETGADHVWLDARDLGSEVLERRFPSILAKCRSYGIDPVTDLVPVSPAQHYASGGVRTDSRGRTSIPGLYACGEVSCTGVHGANRLASNSLLEGLVWGHRIASDLAETQSSVLPGDPIERPRAGLLHASARPFVQSATTAGAGVVRSAATLDALHSRLEVLWQERQATVPTTAAWETTNLHAVAVCLGRHAAVREETRGGHWRDDFPDSDDRRWRGRLVSKVDPDGMVVTKYEPIKENA